MSITAKQLIEKARMSTRPEYYSGRGVNLSDLNWQHLQVIYNGIKENLDDAACQNFLQLIENIQSLSATNFLNQLYSLESNGWIYRPFSEDDIDLGPDIPQRGTIAFATLMSPYNRCHNADTNFIRNKFFYLIGYKTEELVSYFDHWNSGWNN